MDSESSSAPDLHAPTEKRLGGVIVADSKGIIRSANDQVCRIFGYNKHQLLGQDIKMLMEAAYREQHDHYVQNFLRTGKGKVVGTTRVVVGVDSNGERLKLRLALSFVPSESDPLFCALVERMEDHSFKLVADAEGNILSVRGNPRATFGYSSETLVGANVALLMSKQVAQRHAAYMKCYTSAEHSKIIGKVRNLEARHLDGHLFPICLEVLEESRSPLTFSATITEVEGTTEGVINVDQKGIVTSLSDSCRLLFGYEMSEMVGQHVTKISPHVELKTGNHVVSCTHKDRSTFFLSVDVTRYTGDDGRMQFRGIVRRVLSSKVSRKKPHGATDDHIFTGDLLGWYEISRSLGSGYFGTVKMATHRLTGLDVAVKTLKKKQYEEAGMAYPPREIDLVRKLNHPYICRLYDTIYTDECIFMITEVVPGGELFDYVAQKGHLNEDEARHIMRQLFSATDYMHRSGIVHRDLKMENILMDIGGGIKVIDLGLGNYFDRSGKHLLNTFCGSADYAAPELWRGEKYLGPGVDIWSLGVVLFVIVTGFIPFNDSNHVMDIRYHFPKSGTYSLALKDLIGSIFQPTGMRIDMEGCLKHPWLSDNGNLPPIERLPLKLDATVITEAVLAKMEELGFKKEDVQKAVLEDAHNQLTTTYYLLVHHHEQMADPAKALEHKKLKQAAQESPVSTPTTQVKEAEHDYDSRKNSNHCIIS